MNPADIKTFAVLSAFEAYLPNGVCLQVYKKELRVIGAGSTTTTRFRSAALAQAEFLRRVHAEPAVLTLRQKMVA